MQKGPFQMFPFAASTSLSHMFLAIFVISSCSHAVVVCVDPYSRCVPAEGHGIYGAGPLP